MSVKNHILLVAISFFGLNLICTNSYALNILKGNCPDNFSQLYAQTVIQLTTNADIIRCQAIRQNLDCDKVQSSLPLDEKDRILKCDAKSLDENSMGEMELMTCSWKGLKISAENLLSLVTLPNKIYNSIVEDLDRDNACKQDYDKKMQAIDFYNLTIADPNFKLSEEMFKARFQERFKEMPCSEIQYHARIFYNEFLKSNARSSTQPQNKLGITLPTQYASSSTLLQSLKDAIKESGIKMGCYTPKAKAEMLCAGVVSLLTDVALGGGLTKAVNSIKSVAQSRKALGAINDSLAKGEKIALEMTGFLRNKERLEAAEKILGRALTKKEKIAIIEAHEIGIKEGRGFYTYTQKDISDKVRILKERGFSSDQVRALMESGVTGTFADKTSMLSYFKEQLKLTSIDAKKEQALVLLYENKALTTSSFFIKDTQRLKLTNAGFTRDEADRILGLRAGVEKMNGVVASEAPKEAVISTPVVTSGIDRNSAGFKGILNNHSNDPLFTLKTTEVTKAKYQELFVSKGGPSHTDLVTEAEKTIIANRETIAKSKAILATLPTESAKKAAVEEMTRAEARIEVSRQRCLNILKLAEAYYGAGSTYTIKAEQIAKRACL